MGGVLGIVVGLTWALGGASLAFDIHWPTVGLVIAAFVVVGVFFWINFMRIMRGLAPAAGGTLLGQGVFTLSSQGIHVESPRCVTLVRWSGVKSVDEGPEPSFIRVDTCAGYGVPERCLGGDGNVATFLSRARQHLQG